jgi:hypothetical protein
MKHFADNKRSDRSFQVGDITLKKKFRWAIRFICVCSLIYSPPCQCQALLQVLRPFPSGAARRGPLLRPQVADKLQVAPVFHVFQLRAGAPPEVHPKLPIMDDVAPPHQVSEQVLQTRSAQRRHKIIEQGLIQWSGMPASLATWGNLLELKERFPNAPAWCQAARDGGRLSCS